MISCMKGDCQFVYFQTEFYRKKILHEIMGDVTPNKDQLPVFQQSWKRKNSPGTPKILIILYITWVYNRGQRLLHVSRSFVLYMQNTP